MTQAQTGIAISATAGTGYTFSSWSASPTGVSNLRQLNLSIHNDDGHGSKHSHSNLQFVISTCSINSRRLSHWIICTSGINLHNLVNYDTRQRHNLRRSINRRLRLQQALRNRLTFSQRATAAISSSRTLQTFWAVKATSGQVTITVNCGGQSSQAVAFAISGAVTQLHRLTQLTQLQTQAPAAQPAQA